MCSHQTNGAQLSLLTLWPGYFTVGINYTGQDTVVLMAAAQCAGCQRGISQRFLAGAKGGTDIWEGPFWSRTKN